MRICKKFWNVTVATVIAVVLILVLWLSVGELPMVQAAQSVQLAMSVQAAQANRQGRDFSELEKQIGIANGLDSYDYTKETWEVLSSAVEAGNKLLEGGTEQSKLDEAAQAVKLALEQLVKMDYSALISALDSVYAKMDENPEKHDAWYRLDKAVDKARPLLVSGDQQAVDDMALLLDEIMAELATYDEAGGEPEVIIQEVKVEVPPESDFCNIAKHRIWPVVCGVSALLNIFLFTALSLVLLRKRKTTDNTPLVSYDIEDDIDL